VCIHTNCDACSYALYTCLTADNSQLETKPKTAKRITDDLINAQHYHLSTTHQEHTYIPKCEISYRLIVLKRHQQHIITVHWWKMVNHSTHNRCNLFWSQSVLSKKSLRHEAAAATTAENGNANQTQFPHVLYKPSPEPSAISCRKCYDPMKLLHLKVPPTQQTWWVSIILLLFHQKPPTSRERTHRRIGSTLPISTCWCQKQVSNWPVHAKVDTSAPLLNQWSPQAPQSPKITTQSRVQTCT